MPSLSPNSLEALIDLVEIKLSCLDVFDRADRKEQIILKHALAELEACRKTLAGRRRLAAAPAEALAAH